MPRPTDHPLSFIGENNICFRLGTSERYGEVCVATVPKHCPTISEPVQRANAHHLADCWNMVLELSQKLALAPAEAIEIIPDLLAELSPKDIKNALLCVKEDRELASEIQRHDSKHPPFGLIRPCTEEERSFVECESCGAFTHMEKPCVNCGENPMRTPPTQEELEAEAADQREDEMKDGYHNG